MFLFWELRGPCPNFHIHASVSVLYIPRIGPHITSSRIGRPMVGIYNSLTDTWMWKLGLSPRYSFSGKICFIFSAFCLCSARGVSCKENVRGHLGQGHIVTAWVQSGCLFLWWWQWTSWLSWSPLAPAFFNRYKVLILHMRMELFKEYTYSSPLSTEEGS